MRPESDSNPTVEITDFTMGVDFAKHLDETKTMILRSGRITGKTTQALAMNCIEPRDNVAWIRNENTLKQKELEEKNGNQAKMIAMLKFQVEEMQGQITAMSGVIADLEKKLKKERKKVKKLIDEGDKIREANRLAEIHNKKAKEPEGPDRNILV
jgi:uncharacterized coiled-coil protein SlyX